MRGTKVGIGSIRTQEERRRYENGEDRRSYRKFQRQYARMVHESLAAERFRLIETDQSTQGNTVAAIGISDEDFKLLKTVNNLRSVGHPVPLDIATAASSLVDRGLIAVDEDGHFVPDDVKWKLVADQRPLK